MVFARGWKIVKIKNYLNFFIVPNLADNWLISRAIQALTPISEIYFNEFLADFFLQQWLFLTENDLKIAIPKCF